MTMQQLQSVMQERDEASEMANRLQAEAGRLRGRVAELEATLKEARMDFLHDTDSRLAVANIDAVLNKEPP